VIDEAKRKSTNAKVRYNGSATLARPIVAHCSTGRFTKITTLEVAAVLKPVWHPKPEIARKLYPAIRRVFEYARICLRDEHGIAMSDNPARWADLKAMGFEPPTPTHTRPPPIIATRPASRFLL
jgi:hypothetical protein